MENRDQGVMNMGMGYGRFAAMIATSTVVMFGLMYLNTYAWSHVEYSQTRMWMAVVMGATMGVIMLGFMWSMYIRYSRSTERCACGGASGVRDNSPTRVTGVGRPRRT